MSDIDKELTKKKCEIENIELPEDLELRLRIALDSDKKNISKTKAAWIWFIRHRAAIAIVAFIIFFGASNYDVLAYYSKKIIGYDEITYGSIKELNEKGMSQKIDKSYTFRNGTQVTLDGVMMDENKLILMYRIKADTEEKVSNLSIFELKGAFKEYSPSSGYGKSSDDRKEIAWVQEFQAPNIFDRNLVFKIMSTSKDASSGEIAQIKFKLDLNKAVKRMLKLSIYNNIEFGGVKYKFNELTATAMSVTVKGNIETSSEKDFKLFTSDLTGTRRNSVLELWETYNVNGKLVTEKIQGGISNIRSDGKNISFECSFQGLKPGFKKLELNLLKTSDMTMIDKSLPINTDTREVDVTDKHNELIIKEVRTPAGRTIVKFNTENDVAFDTALFIDGNQVNTLSESQKNIKIKNTKLLEKTYVFDGTGSDMKLMFKTINHESNINKQITLYEEK